MRRDRELILRLLVKLEEWPSRPGDMFVFNGHEPELAIEGYSAEQIEYHLSILKTEGYIDSPGSQPMQGVTFRSLTPAGHDLVDRYREVLELQAAEKSAEESRNWIPAAEAAALLKPVFKSKYLAQMTICKRAHAGLIRARAERFVANGKQRDLPEIPKEFWWAEGHEALHQTWPTGDFDTWVDRNELHLEAFGVSFSRADIEKMIPADQLAPAATAPPPAPTAPIGGRPPAEWWDDLWVEICRQLYVGDLKPTKQGDIETAMLEWLSDRGETPSTSTIRRRARKLWTAIMQESENP